MRRHDFSDKTLTVLCECVQVLMYMFQIKFECFLTQNKKYKNTCTVMYSYLRVLIGPLILGRQTVFEF